MSLSSQRPRPPRPISRREALLLAGAGGAGLLLGACGGGSMMGGRSRDPRSAAQGDVPSTPGWVEPPVLASTAGLLEADLKLAPKLVPYGAGSRWALTVNGTSPGPTLRVRPGDRLRLVLDNQTEHATNLHTHGLHVSPSGNSDNPFVEVRAGERFAYEVAIPPDHPGGLFWYHPHHHGRVAEQLFAGLFGAIIVEDDFDRLPAVAEARERLLLVHDATPAGSASTAASASMMEQMTGREGGVVLVNGVPLPTIQATTGALERWRILNASASRFYRLILSGHRFSIVAGDGGRLASAADAVSVLLVPGERIEAFVQPAAPGSYVLETSAVDRGSADMGMGMGGMMGGSANLSSAANLLHFVVTGEASDAAPVPSPGHEVEELRRARVDRTRALTLNMGMMRFSIDGRAFDPSRVDIHAVRGSIEEWTIQNRSTMDHPFHLHVWPFQVIDQSRGSAPSGWKDVVNVPAGGWVRIRMRFSDYAGRSVYHCHIVDHEDLGMMGVIEVA